MTQHTIRLGDAIELQLLECGTAAGHSEGDLRLCVSVEMDDFSGSYDQVWITRDDWRGFVDALGRLERTREGEASLFAMSPDEFELHIKIIDAARHVAVHGFLARLHWHGLGEASRSRIEYSCPVEASLLRELVDSLRALGDSSQ